MADTWGDSPVHPIISRAHEYCVVRFDYHCDYESWRDSYLDLTLRRGDSIRRLRFIRPRRLRIDAGFPAPTGGMIILDIRHRQWEDVSVEVADFEASHGAVTFVAADVVDLDRQALTSGCS